jgi:hypothetical protein
MLEYKGQSTQDGVLFFFFPPFVLLRFELKAYTLSHSTSLVFVCLFLVMVLFFEIGSHKLFAQAGFEL